MGTTKAMFRADWNDALFMHFQVDPSLLARAVPFELDAFEGQTLVSLVAFTQCRLRPTVGGRIAEFLSGPLATHAFLNLRAYVRVNGRRAIYFVAEWIPNRLAVLVGPRVYGLPYRLGRLKYEKMLNGKPKGGRVCSWDGAFEFRVNEDDAAMCDVAVEGSLDHFLLERYVAFTHRYGVSRYFEVDHAPWRQRRVEVCVRAMSLFDGIDFMRTARLVGANFSPGVRDVAISRPGVLKTTERWSTNLTNLHE